MSNNLLRNAGRMQIVEQELSIAQASVPEQVIVRLDAEATLGLADWLALCRGRLFQAVMRDGLEAFKAQVRAEYHLPKLEEPEERVIYVPPSSCDETLIALTRASGVAMSCDTCQQPLCTDCYNCHNRYCRRYYQHEESHVMAPPQE
jgi:hypothetical protein